MSSPELILIPSFLVRNFNCITCLLAILVTKPVNRRKTKLGRTEEKVDGKVILVD